MANSWNKTLKLWQTRLGLLDWTIKLYPDCTPEEIPLPEACGTTECNEVLKAANIMLLREDCYPSNRGVYDKEKTLVHELLHLKFCLLDASGNELQDRIVHQLVDDLARALVAADRGT